MINDFSDVQDTSAMVPPIPSTLSFPISPKKKGKKHKGKGKHKRKGKHKKKANYGLKKAVRTLQEKTEQVSWQNGVLSSQNEMLRLMLQLAVVSNQQSLKTEIIKDGLRLLPKGRDH